MRDDPAEPTPAGGAAALRCSSFARSEDLDPVGSAGSYRGIVLAEIPLPWPRDIAEYAALAGVAEALGAANMRLQGLVPDDRSERTLHVDEAARLYRGCTGIDGPEVQAAEREALRSVGWSWLDHRRLGEVVESAGGRSLVRLDAEAPDGRRLTFEVTVEVARILPVPDCGKPPEQAPKSAPELRVTGFAAA
jgi:hypothetical protein